jgi:membrane-bound serine protease (ClpP class)
VSGISAQTTAPSSSTAIVELSGTIDDYSARSVMRRINLAREHGAQNVILAINTWGGQVTSALEISQFLKRQDDLHIVAFVTDKAISAGAMIAVACDEIVMQPGSRIGDCAPIAMRSDGGLEPLPAAERAKIESPILADFRESARRNGYDQLLAEAMVSVGHVVYYLQDSAGAKRFADSEGYATLTKEGWTSVSDVPSPLDRDSELLTLDAELAQRIGLSKATISSPDTLATDRGWNVTSRSMQSWGEELINILNAPLARSLVLTIFMWSLYLALSTPGHGVPESFAMISLGLLIGVPLLTGYAQWWEILLIFLGLALIAFEIFVFPGHLVSLGIGILLLVGGLVLTFVPKEPTGLPGILPQLPQSWDAMAKGLITVTSAVVASIALWFWLQRYLPQLPYFNRLVLMGSGAMATSPVAHESPWPVVGMQGEAQTDLRPGGSATFFDAQLGETRSVSVVSDRGFVLAGTKLDVVEVSGNRIVVRPSETIA